MKDLLFKSFNKFIRLIYIYQFMKTHGIYFFLNVFLYKQFYLFNIGNLKDKIVIKNLVIKVYNIGKNGKLMLQLWQRISHHQLALYLSKASFQLKINNKHKQQITINCCKSRTVIE